MNEHWELNRQIQESDQKALIGAGILEIVDDNPASFPALTAQEKRMRDEHEKRMKEFVKQLPPYQFEA